MHRQTSLIAFLTILGHAGFSMAMPTFAAREAKECAYCHIDPAGGGPRNPRGNWYEEHGYSFEGFDEAAIMQAGLAEIGGMAFQFSGDLRMAFSTSEGDDSSRAVQGRDCTACHATIEPGSLQPPARAPDGKLLVMQGELQVHARISDRISAVYSNDLGRTRDLYALFRHPYGEGDELFVKVGLLEIPFGIKLRDHNTLVLAAYNVGSNKRDTGLEIGGAHSVLFYDLALFTGGFRNPVQPPVAEFRNNKEPGASGNVGIRYGPLRVGGTFFLDTDAARAARHRRGGVFGTFAYRSWLYQGLGVLGFDKLRTRDIQGQLTPRRDVDSGGSYHRVSYDVTPRVRLSAQYDFFDPDTDVKDDSERWMTFEIKHDVVQNTSVQLLFRIRDEDGPRAAPNNDLLSVLHVYF